ncbi:MAG: hypothetical protein P9L92_17410 [Candidatus Electryonea clarkiae]|nr:hypothetical protein [Candidatus Electryonea clarkiae]MDP8287282.1 hypothetical protein [Candidatus Electryonea clarkiae]
MILQGCLNPFAPEIGEISGDIWHDQTSVGGLLRNFQTSYTLGDSLRYADLIAEEFEFQYFNVELNRYDQWYRDTELKTTGGLMRSVDRLDLRWGPWSDELDSLSLPDTTVEFTVNFSLSAGEYQPVFGFARFTVKADEDGLFRIHLWRDDF